MNLDTAILIAAISITAIIVIVAVVKGRISRSAYSAEDREIIEEVRRRFIKLNPRYAEIPLFEGDSSFTENKETITLCIKDPTTGKHYDMNSIMYVALHELCHATSSQMGHGDEFKRNFQKLLNEAEKRGLYSSRIEMPPVYCGVPS
jgi:hypothetical protein